MTRNKKMKMKASKMSLPIQVGVSCEDLITDKSGKGDLAQGPAQFDSAGAIEQQPATEALKTVKVEASFSALCQHLANPAMRNSKTDI